jgi:hypothetical protein
MSSNIKFLELATPIRRKKYMEIDVRLQSLPHGLDGVAGIPSLPAGQARQLCRDDALCTVQQAVTY